jgi:Rrf2 family protein
VAGQESEKKYVNIREMSESMDISFHFLTKILQKLTQHGLLVSYRGPNGGVALTRPPEQIFMVEVVKVLEGQNFFETCFLGFDGCGKEAPCPMHHFWVNVRSVFLHEFTTTSLAQLGMKIRSGQMRF